MAGPPVHSRDPVQSNGKNATEPVDSFSVLAGSAEFTSLPELEFLAVGAAEFCPSTWIRYMERGGLILNLRFFF